MDFILKAVAVIAPIIAIAVFALPSYIGVLWQRGFFRGFFMLLVLSAYAVGIYTLMQKTGLPGGDFSYASVLGHKLFGTTPWVLAFAYPPILLAGFWMASKFTRNFGRVILTAIFTTLIMVVLEPATVKLQLWKWAEPGQFYGVPPAVFGGWVVIGLVGGWLAHALWGKEKRVRASAAYSGIVILLFWAGANVGIEQWVPAGLGGFQAIALIAVLLLERNQFKDEPKEN